MSGVKGFRCSWMSAPDSVFSIWMFRPARPIINPTYSEGIVNSCVWISGRPVGLDACEFSETLVPFPLSLDTWEGTEIMMGTASITNMFGPSLAQNATKFLQLTEYRMDSRAAVIHFLQHQILFKTNHSWFSKAQHQLHMWLRNTSTPVWTIAQQSWTLQSTLWTFNYALILNSLWCSGTIWQHRSRLSLAQVMACCLTAPSHYLRQCWLIFGEDQWHSPEGNFTGNAQGIYPSYEFEHC